MYSETRSAYLYDNVNISIFPTILDSKDLNITGLDIEKGLHELEVYNIYGILVNKQSIKQNQMTLSSNLTFGNYIIRIKDLSNKNVLLTKMIQIR